MYVCGVDEVHVDDVDVDDVDKDRVDDDVDEVSNVDEVDIQQMVWRIYALVWKM